MTNPNRHTTILITSLLALSAATLWGVSQRNEQAEMLLEQAQQKELVDGRLEEAISIYKDVLARFSKNRAAGARALVQMGQCYEKMGRDEALKAYERVLKEYADQSAAVDQARTRLALLRRPLAGPLGLANRRIWAGPEVDVLGSVSSDGRILSFTDWQTGDLALRDLEAGKNRRLTNKGSWNDSSEYAEYSVVSPDGRQVAYAWFDEDQYDLRVTEIANPKPRILCRDPDLEWVQPAAWSPDGKYILAIFRRKDVAYQMVLVSATDGSLRVLKSFGPQAPVKMSISPDGRFVAYDFPPKEESANRDIFLLPMDGGRESALIEHPANDLYAVWTPDGKHVLFASDRTGSMSMWLVAVADGRARGQPELIKEDVGRRILPMNFTREGSFYYGLETGTMDVYIVTFNFKTGTLLTQPKRATERFVGSNSRPDWSRDGRYLAYVSHRGPNPSGPGTVAVCIRSLETGEERDLYPKLNYIWDPSWSPDGRSILLLATDVRNRRGLYMMDVKSGALTPLVQDREGEYSSRQVYSRDGKVIFYRRQEPTTKKSTIVAREIETGREREILSVSEGSGLSAYELSPDGQWIVFWHYDGAARVQSLKIIPSDGGTPREIVRAEKGENIPGFTALAWSPDGSQVLFTKGPASPQDPTFALWRVPAEGGKAQPVGLAMKYLRGLRVHPDGQRLAMYSGDAMSSQVWVMENLLPPAPPKKE